MILTGPVQRARNGKEPETPEARARHQLMTVQMSGAGVPTDFGRYYHHDETGPAGSGRASGPGAGGAL